MTEQRLVRWQRKAPEPDPPPIAAEPELPESLALVTFTPIDTNPAAVYLARLGSEKSRAAMRGALRRILVALGSPADPLAFPWDKIRYQHATVIRSALVESHSPATVNQALSALRGVMHEAFRLGLISGEDWARAKDVQGVKAQRLPRGRAVPPHEMSALFAVCDRSDPIGIRDAALLATLRIGGVRRAELCAMNLEDVDLDAGEVRVIGKGNKERLIVLGDAIVDIAAWIEVRGSDPGPLFLSFDPPQGGGIAHDGPRRLTDGAVRYLVRKLADAADVRALGPHDMRRTFVSELLDANVDISTVQKMAGHASVATTQRYDRRGIEPQRKAAALIKIPR